MKIKEIATELKSILDTGHQLNHRNTGDDPTEWGFKANSSAEIGWNEPGKPELGIYLAISPIENETMAELTAEMHSGDNLFKLRHLLWLAYQDYMTPEKVDPNRWTLVNYADEYLTLEIFLLP